MAEKRRTIRHELSGESAQYQLPAEEVDVHVAGMPSWVADTPSPLTPDVATLVSGTEDLGFQLPAYKPTDGPTPTGQKTEVYELMGSSVAVGSKSWSPYSGS